MKEKVRGIEMQENLLKINRFGHNVIFFYCSEEKRMRSRLLNFTDLTKC